MTRDAPAFKLRRLLRDALAFKLRRPLRDATAGPASPRTLALAAGLGFFLLMAGWAFITPMNATDEAAQVVKAAATVRLQNLGTVEHVAKTALGLPGRSPLTVGEVSVYRVPASFDVRLIPCFTNGATSPACARHMTDDARTVSAISYVGNYNPLYYVLVGWPTLLLLGAKCVYLMRLCSALLNALLLGLAARTALEARHPRRALLCLAAAATPMTLFFGGIVNPNGTEICAAMLVWSVALRLATAESGAVPDVARRLAGRGALGLILLFNLRMLGPLWVALIALVGLWVARQDTRRALLRCRTLRIAAFGGSLLGAGSLLWTRFTPMELVSLGSARPRFLRAARLTLDLAPRHLREMLFSYDWAEVQLPMLACVLLTCVLALLLAPLLADRRYVLPFLAMAVGVIAIPVVLQGYEMRTLGMVWQGRYLLPYATGLVLLAGFADLDVRRAAPELSGRGLEHWLNAFVGVSGLTCFWWAVRHNANRKGIAGPLLPRHVHWAPAMTWPGAVLPYLLGAALLGWAQWRCVERTESAAAYPAAAPVPVQPGQAPVPSAL